MVARLAQTRRSPLVGQVHALAPPGQSFIARPHPSLWTSIEPHSRSSIQDGFCNGLAPAAWLWTEPPLAGDHISRRGLPSYGRGRRFDSGGPDPSNRCETTVGTMGSSIHDRSPRRTCTCWTGLRQIWRFRGRSSGVATHSERVQMAVEGGRDLGPTCWRWQTTRVTCSDGEGGVNPSGSDEPADARAAKTSNGASQSVVTLSLRWYFGPGPDHNQGRSDNPWQSVLLIRHRAGRPGIDLGRCCQSAR